MARTWIVAGVAWAGIVWLAYRQAEEHIGYCVQNYWNCNAATAITTRDNVLIWGGSIPLALFVLLAIAGRVRIERLNLRWPRRGPAPSAASREVVVHERGEDHA